MSEQQQSVTSEIIGDLFVDFNLLSSTNNNPKPNYEIPKPKTEVQNPEKILPNKKSTEKVVLTSRSAATKSQTYGNWETNSLIYLHNFDECSILRMKNLKKPP